MVYLIQGGSGGREAGGISNPRAGLVGHIDQRTGLR